MNSDLQDAFDKYLKGLFENPQPRVGILRIYHKALLDELRTFKPKYLPPATPAHPEDILEYALNYGFEAAMISYSVPFERVKQIVMDFKIDNGDLDDERCPCEMERDNGTVVMCFFCSGPAGLGRINIRELAKRKPPYPLP